MMEVIATNHKIVLIAGTGRFLGVLSSEVLAKPYDLVPLI